MKMIKFLSLIAFALLCSSVQASVMYWQVDKADYAGITAADDVNAFGLYALGANNERRLIDSYVGEPGQKSAAVDVTLYSENYSFIIELYKYDESSNTYAQLGQGETATYDQLEDLGFIGNELTPVAQAAAWHGGTMTVPEPTSGFLMMVGLALLGLKRRKV